MIPFLLAPTAVALDCEALDFDVCSTTESIVESLNEQRGSLVVHEDAAARLQPIAVYEKLARVRDQLDQKGCVMAGWSAGVYGADAGRWDGVYDDGAEPGVWVGDYDLGSKTLGGTWTDAAGDHVAGELFSAFNKQGQAVADMGVSRLLAGVWIRERGRTGLFAFLHGDCAEGESSFEAADGVFRGEPTAAPPVCPEVTLQADSAVSVADLGITAANGDPLAPLGVRLIDGDGTVLVQDATDGIELVDTFAFRDPRGLALPHLEVDVPGVDGRAATCSFAVEPANGLVCAPAIRRTVFDPAEPAAFHPGDDCTLLSGDRAELSVVDITTPDGEPIPWESDGQGGAKVFVPPGSHTLQAVTERGDPVRFTIEVRDTWGLMVGSTPDVPEGGGTIDTAVALEFAQAAAGPDPLEPLFVELIAPDLSRITASDVVGDELVVPRAPTEQQGAQLVTPKLLLHGTKAGEPVTFVLDVPVNEAPYCRADGPLTQQEDGSFSMPLDWCTDAEGDDLLVAAVTREDGGEVPFDIQDGHLRVAADCCGSGSFTIDMRDTFFSAAKVASGPPWTIGTGTFTITSRDDFSAL